MKRTIIIDGYNVLRSGSRYKTIESPDYTDDLFNASREKLFNDVASYAGRDVKATVVFDGGGNALSRGKAEMVGSVQVIFSRAGQSADNVIEKLAHEARERGEEVTVITSDSTVQNTVYSAGVNRMSAEGFCREMQLFYHEVEEDSKPQTAQKRTIADRIDPEILEKLRCIRDGS